MRQRSGNSDVQKLRESLAELPEPMVSPPFIVVSGLPGTGKSFFSRKLAKELFLPILESDTLRKVLFPSPNYSPKESARLFHACHLLIEALLRRGIPLIFDATNLAEHRREHLYRIADKAGARLIMVQVEAPPMVVQERLRARANHVNPEDNSDADWKVYQRMKPEKDKICRNHFTVDTSRDIAPVIEKIVREVKR